MTSPRHIVLPGPLGTAENRHEGRATVITSNLAFAEWSRVFGDDTLTAACEATAHRSEVLELTQE